MSRLTCTGASGIYQAAGALRACSQDLSYVQYFNLCWIFFIHKKVVLGRKRNMCIQKEFTFHEHTNMPTIFVT